MKNKLAWFTIGFAVCCLIWSVIAYLHFLPKDYSSVNVGSRYGPDWMKSAKGGKFGNFYMFASTSPSEAEVMIFPIKPIEPIGRPQVTIIDMNKDGKLDIIEIVDETNRSIEINDINGDGIFDAWSYYPGSKQSQVGYCDRNMDGQPDKRFGPDKAKAIYIDGQWRDLISQNSKQYVKIDNVLKLVKEVDGVFQIVEEK